MKYRPLGQTGLFVSELCLGPMTFGGQNGWWKAVGSVPQAEATALLVSAFEHGINFIDTADNYAEGVGEQMVGVALADSGVRRTDVVVATKAFNPIGPGPNDRGLSRGHLRDSVRRSLDRLKLDYIDLYQLHGSDTVTPLEETLAALDDMVREGLIRYAGCSNWPAWRMMKALALNEHRGLRRLATTQLYYSMAGRDIERELVPLIQDQAVGLLVWSPLAGGLLSGKFGPGAPEDDSIGAARRSLTSSPRVDMDRALACIAAMRPMAQALGVSVAQVAIAWVLSKPFVSSVTIGVKSIAQLESNIAAADVILPPDSIAELDSISQLPPEYPGWSLERQASVRAPPESVVPLQLQRDQRADA